MKKQGDDPAISLREFMRRAGLGYSIAKRIWKMPGFPELAGKVHFSDYIIWRRRRMEVEAIKPPAAPAVVATIPLPESNVKLPPRAERLRQMAGRVV